MTQSKFSSENSNRVIELFSGLLAAESITIVHSSNIDTAAFDVEKRTLMLPTWKNVSDELYCLLIGHEVSHALHTPREYADLFDRNNSRISACVNLIEDVRVDRLIKSKYPGLKYDYKVGFRELHNREFFGFSGKTFDDTSILNKLNVYFKLVRNDVEIEMSLDEKEKYFIDKIEKCVSFTSVVNVAKELADYVKEKKKEQKNKETENSHSENSKNENSKENNSSEQKEDEEDSSDKSASKNSEDSKEDQNDSTKSSSNSSSDSENSEEDQDASERSSGDSCSDSGNKEEDSEDEEDEEDQNDADDDMLDDGEISTQNNLSENIRDSANHDPFSNNRNSRREVCYLDIPSYDSTRYITDYKKILSEYSLEFRNKAIIEANTNHVRSTNRTTVDYLVKEFEMRKSALINAKQRLTKSGILNVDKIHTYKFNDDIFKKSIRCEKGKNHGVILLIDLSGSMSENVVSVIEQTLNLVMFCKKVKIPFEVFGFTCDNNRNYNYYGTSSTEILINKKISVRQYVSSKMKDSEYSSAIENLVTLMSCHMNNPNFGSRSDFSLPRSEIMGGTPLAETLVILHQFIGKFKSSNSLDIVNLITITDGGDSEGIRTQSFSSRSLRIKQTFVRDKVNNVVCDISKDYNSYSRDEVVAAFLNLIKKVYACNIIGYYLVPERGRGGARGFRQFCRRNNIPSSRMQEFRDNSFITTYSPGYDEYFVMEGGSGFRVSNLDSLEEVTGKTATVIRKSFQKILKNRVNSRVILKKLIESIA